ncbi:tyrosine-type recombinase/integrase [Neobacillus ginsengisoli]|uniref:Integrase n=1 Tax=Neobacillus ginsengisoli TaxID=904295 RepID=A0ABT9XQ51_9BACI|nr:tyrosine-type recombinase/integrase [Neobacillus ginsengisoli]MDQ0197082.1 integrase [Neobacillus ginsengisoli]
MVCEPIKDKEIVKEILEALRMRRNGFRDALFFEFLLSTALRVSDALSIPKKDIDFIEGTVRVHISKTKGFKIIKLNPPILKDLHQYTKDMRDTDLIFPFKRQWAHKMMKWACEMVGLDKSRYSIHSTKKTAGWFFYISQFDIVKTMHFLGHRDTKETMAYLMIHDEEVNQQLAGMSWR